MFKNLNINEYNNWGEVNKSLNYDINEHVSYCNSIVFNHNLYVFWIEYNTTNNNIIYQLRYKYYDGTIWHNDNESLNYDMSKNIDYHNSIVFENKLYIFWIESNKVNNKQIRYKYYDGTKWYNDNNSLNYDSSKNTYDLNNIIYNKKLYVFWREANSNNVGLIRYKYYDGTKWNNDNGSINYDVSKHASDPNSCIFNNNLYIFWLENNESVSQVRYKYYDGVKWNNDNGSLNYNISKSANYKPSTIIYNNNLYVFWNEHAESSSFQIRYKYYDGAKWNNDNDSFNYDSSKVASVPKSIIYNNALYVFWRENNTNNIGQIRYKYYNGVKWNESSDSLNHNKSNFADLYCTNIYNNNLYVFWREFNEASIYQLRYKHYSSTKWYLIKNRNSIYQMNPLSKLQNITQSNLTSETFMEYGSNKLILTENEYNELSDDAELLVYNSSQKELKLHKNITYDKRFIMTLDKPKIRIRPNNLDLKPKLMLNAHRLMEYKYDVKIDALEKPIKEVIEIKYDIDDEAVIRKDTFKTSENPYVATITVEQENGDIVKKNGSLTLYNREPKLLITMTGMLMRLEIGDDDKNKIKYRMLLNGKQIYPLDGDWSSYFDTPYSIARKFKSNEISVGRNNVIQVFVKDEYEKQSSLTYNFIGEYSGLLFCDELGGYYSDDLANIVKRLNFGNILAGKTSEVKTVYLKNACGYNIKDVVIKVTENLIPSGSDILIDSEKDNFIGSHEIKIERLPNEEVIPFYIRVKTDIEQEQGGRFEITVNSTSSEI